MCDHLILIVDAVPLPPLLLYGLLELRPVVLGPGVLLDQVYQDLITKNTLLAFKRVKCYRSGSRRIRIFDQIWDFNPSRIC